jgi:hypothetical protein
MSPLIYGRVIERLLLVTCAPLLLYIGYRLFILGISGQIRVDADLKDKFRLKLVNLTPGSFCFVLAITIASVSYFRPLSITQQDQEALPTNPDLRGKTESTRGSDQAAYAENRPNKTDLIDPVTGKTSSKSVEISFEGGKPIGTSATFGLSVDLRRGLSEVALCQLSQPQGGPQSCYASTGFNARFNRIPLESDLTDIEAVEVRLTKSPTEADMRSYANYKRIFLKGGTVK